MTRVVTVSGHSIVFSLRAEADGRPTAELLVAKDDRVAVKGIGLTGADVEAVLSVLLRIREKQREYEVGDAADDPCKPTKMCMKRSCVRCFPCRSCRRERCVWCFPNGPTPEDGSKAPPPTQAPATGKRRKTTAK